MTTLQKMSCVMALLSWSAGSAHAADFPITLDDAAKVLGKPDQKNDTSILYSGKVKVTQTKTGLDIAFSTGNNEALFFMAGFFTSKLFPKKEGEDLIDFIDEVGKSKTIGRFKVEVSKATIPSGWRQVSLTPKE